MTQLLNCPGERTTQTPGSIFSVEPLTFLSRFKFPEIVSRSVISDSCNPMDYSPPGFSVHGILQARILEWVAIYSSRGSSLHRIKPGSFEMQAALQADSLLSELPRKPFNT